MFRRRCAMFLSFLAVVSMSSAASAGVQDETEILVGTVTGNEYGLRYSCPEGVMQRTTRSDAGRFTESELEMLRPGSDAGATFTSGVQASTKASVFKSGLSSGGEAGRWVFRERFQDEGQFIEIGSGTWDCPIYDKLPTSRFVPVPPTRVLDTRSATRINHAGGKPAPESAVAVTRSMLPDLPVDAIAVSATVTITEASAPGFVSLLPSNQTTPTTSTLNAEVPGQTLANNSVTTLGPAGLRVFTKSGGHLLIDVNGYFVAAPGAVSAGRLVPLTPTRILDTRPEFRTGHSGDKPSAGVILTLDVAGLPAVPTGGLQAAVVNVTATATSGAGFLQVAATGELTPRESSILNIGGVNETIAGFTIVPVDSDGSFDLFTSGGSHLVVDVLGYFTAASAGADTSGRFVALPPERILDTRNTSPINSYAFYAFGDEDRLTGRKSAGSLTQIRLARLQEVAGAVLVNLTAVDATAPGFLQTDAQQRLDPGSSSNVNVSRPGANVANAAIAEVSSDRFPNGGIDILTSGGGHIVADLAGFFQR